MFRKNTDTNQKFILGEKTGSQILRDSENRFIMIVVGSIISIGGIILMIVTANSDLEKKYGFLMLFGSFGVGLILSLLGLRCPFCDSLKRLDRFESKYLIIEKWNYKCFECNLSNKQINEIIDMLNRNVEINSETIARFNRREI